MHAGGDLTASHRQLFAQIEQRSKLRDGFLPGGNVGRGSRRCQPSGERRFSGPRACDRQQLEQRTMAEQVEVVRVEVVVIAKAIAWLARARPAVLDSSQAAFVERDRPRRLVTLTNRPLVPAD